MPLGHTKKWTKMEKCPKTDYTPKPGQDPASCFAEVFLNTNRVLWVSHVAHYGWGTLCALPWSLSTFARQQRGGLFRWDVCAANLGVRDSTRPLHRSLYTELFLCLGLMDHQFFKLVLLIIIATCYLGPTVCCLLLFSITNTNASR